MIEPNPANDSVVTSLAAVYLITLIPFVYYLARLSFGGSEEKALRTYAIRGSIVGAA